VSRSPRRSAALAGALLGLVCAVPARSQDAAPAPDDLTRARQIIAERDRAEIHPGNPLRIAGIGEDADTFLAGTSALAHREHRPPSLDEEESYRRRLAMYEQGSSFTAPTRPAAPAGSTRERSAHGPAPGSASPPRESSNGAPLWLALCGAVAAGVLLIRRSHS